MRNGWAEYFSVVPDYWVKAEAFFVEGNQVAIFGTAAGTCSRYGILKQKNRWQVPAARFALVRDDKVAEWRVYTDKEPIRQIIEREKAQGFCLHKQFYGYRNIHRFIAVHITCQLTLESL